MPFSLKNFAAPSWKGTAMPSVAKVRSSSAPFAWSAVMASLLSKMDFTMLYAHSSVRFAEQMRVAFTVTV